MVKLNEMHNLICENLYDHAYDMCVSKVFFEPYFHVLTALQNIGPKDFPMEKYIIQVDPNSNPPLYIRELNLTKYNIFNEVDVDLLNPAWPHFSSVEFNPSQHDAFQAALTKEFVAIQGPPGTGKTFLGLQIVSTLLDNVDTDTPILVVCFKNHALDQFLENISKKTTNIIRIGGRSKNSNLEKFNIKALRKSDKNRKTYRFWEFQQRLTGLATKYFTMQAYIDSLKKHGIVAIDHLLKYIPCSKLKAELMNGLMDTWLTEGIYYMDQETDYVDEVESSDIPLEPETCHLENNQGMEDADHVDQEPKQVFPLEGLEEVTKQIELMSMDILDTYSETDSVYHDTLDCPTSLISSNNTFQDCSEAVRLFDNFQSLDPEVKDETSSTTSDQQHLNGDSIQTQSEKRLEEVFVDDFSNIYCNIKKNIQRTYTNNFERSAQVEITFSLTIQSYKEWFAYCDNMIEHLKCTNKFNEEVMWMIHSFEVSMQFYKDMISFLNKMIPSNIQISTEQVSKLYKLANKCSIWSLTTQQRWALYHSWVDCLIKDIKNKMINVEKDIRQVEDELELTRNSADLKILQTAKVVGLTTTGAAKLRPMLNKLGAKIVVIEEAAEVLESHIVASLSSQCQHVILIGDHKQLRPNPAVYELCRKFNFDISLFERMVKNGRNCFQLDVQHRMRPEISSLIVPSIYSNLKDDHSVTQRRNILGIKGNLYFINHNQPENKVDLVSHENQFEAEYAVGLAGYLIKQGYTHEEITILSTYKGQMRLISKKKGNLPSELKVTTVDDFQGEENKIIILSLVRSNNENSIGFLKIENRVCVALSRARDGLYIIGNMDILSRNSKLWTEIKQSLTEQNAIGNSLGLYCQNHPETVTQVTKAAQFQAFPEGGCKQMCTTELSCGHECKHYCHPRDQEHTEKYKCTYPCKRKCKRGHPCQSSCSDKCEPCLVKGEHQLPCGHIMWAPCSSNSRDLTCLELVECVLSCGHENLRRCGIKELSLIRCSEPCSKVLKCGHFCEEKCHVQDKLSPFSLFDSKTQKKCTKVCKEPIEIHLKCGHSSKAYCFMSNWSKPKPCEQVVDKTLRCGHTQKVKCVDYKTFEHCSFLVKKLFSCGHEQEVPCDTLGRKLLCTGKRNRLLFCGHELEAFCAAPLKSLKCKERCSKLAACGHSCVELCSRPCKCNVVLETVLSCGHVNEYPCGSPPPIMCSQSCTRVMACGHMCSLVCYELCNLNLCQELTKSSASPACGHGPVDVPCYLRSLGVGSDLTFWCSAACDRRLECGHKCAGKCGKCAKTKVHEKCNKPCDKLLPCSHKCSQLCTEVCAPCQRSCLYHCSHSKCSGICGEHCTPCKENCTSQCIHSQCTRPCSSFCPRMPCNLPCPESLACGHPCLGFCGEVCPELCPQCMPEFAAKLGANNSRLIYLEDCGHIMIAKKIDELFENNFTQIVKCPSKSCQVPIIGTARYRNHVKRILMNISKNKRQMQAKMFMANSTPGQMNTMDSTLARGNLQHQKQSNPNQDINSTQQPKENSHQQRRNSSEDITSSVMELKSQRQQHSYSNDDKNVTKQHRGYSHNQQRRNSNQYINSTQQSRGYSQHQQRRSSSEDINSLVMKLKSQLQRQSYSNEDKNVTEQSRRSRKKKNNKQYQQRKN